ncbi:stonustoxin subunit alpha-like [Cheilinus undulatus]|uniref:stonustoxin subunit alpha-like n=1 Tax=Cheilinus undulatus TaxID=241271 RepID=UPI001BD40D2B|nr:stonustoxin subunit alpha-like [Cheilinus undulatus]
MDSNMKMEVAALGRPFGLGMLYDCRNDSLVPGMTLWNHTDLQNHIAKRPQKHNDFEIVTSESIKDKSSALDVNASLKASLLGGLVQVSGSAKYLNNSKTSKNQARVTLKYKATTKFEELSMDHLGIENVKHRDVFVKGLATHVVTGILYGAQAFFVFDREVSQNEDQKNVEGNLKLVIKKIPCLAIEGKGSLKMEEKDRANVEKFSCSFIGDFSLQKMPTSFEDAIQVYQSLPSLLGANGENAVPMKVWLLPLTTLDSSAAKLVCQISVSLVQESQRVLEDFIELEMRCNDALRTTTAQQFPQIEKKIKAFKDKCSEFKLEFQQALAKKLPSIRGGGEEEAGLTEILRKIHSSPFNSEKLNEWMDDKETEIDTLMSLTDMMKNTKAVPSQNHLRKEILRTKHAVCFVFTSLGVDEPFLSNYLRQKPESENPGDPRTHDVEKEQWYSSEVFGSLRKKAKLFSAFAEANQKNENVKFLTVGMTNQTQKGSSIYLYKDGCPVTEDFEPLSKPETFTDSDVNHNSVTLKFDPPKFGSENITSYSVEYCVSGEEGWKQETAEKSGEITVADLSPNTEYMFRCRAVTDVGVGPANQISSPIKTLSQKKKTGTEEVDISGLHCGVAGRTTKKKPVSEKLKKKGTRINNASPAVYKLTLKNPRMRIKGCRRFNLCKESVKPNRTIMLVGVTGSGKSTLIDGMINYIVGVNWKDDFRFKMIEEDESRSQSESQTSEVTVYKVNHQEGFRIDHSLTIVDTPGFGGTRGIERDREITEMLRNLFSDRFGVSDIHAVCFVAQASLAQLTPTEEHVFHSVLSIFGEDIAENLRVLVTFADGQVPPVLKAINDSGVPCPKTEDGQPVHFKFNNSALFADNTSSADGMNFDEMFWNMGTVSMERFFDALNLIDAKSLTMTKEVLRERQQLEN